MKKYILIVLLAISCYAFSQKSKSKTIGVVSYKDLNLKKHELDSTAKAIVLYEEANTYLDETNKYKFRTDYYFKIKILDKSAINLGDINITFRKDEEIDFIEAYSHNIKDGKIVTAKLDANNIFKHKLNQKYDKVSFAIPKVDRGSVIEYKYSLISPYSSIDDWYFQSDIPKINSVFYASIPGNWKYKLRIRGKNKLKVDSAEIKKRCLYVDGIGQADCILYHYEMENIPAFVEEKHMLAKENFLSRLTLDLISYTDIQGRKTEYTQDWKAVEKSLKKYYFDGQVDRKSIIKRNLPNEILVEQNKLLKAKKVYAYLQNELTWNDKYWSLEKLNLRKVLETKVGGVDALNLMLYNALKSLNLDVSLVMLSTRDNGLPTKLYPILDDFNYVIVKLELEGLSYFLDITEKLMPFGQLPLRCLNGEGRVINFKTQSTWETVKSINSSTQKTLFKLSLNENKDFEGVMKKYYKGYFALNKRKEIQKSKNEYLNEFESENIDFEIKDYSVNNLKTVNNPLEEKYEIVIKNNNKKTEIVFNPFFNEKLKNNPFKLEYRSYPIDFGVTSLNSFALTFDIPQGYQIEKLPSNVAFSLPNKGGSYKLTYVQKGNKITISYRISIRKRIFTSDEYLIVKQFFNQIINSQNNYIKLIQS